MVKNKFMNESIVHNSNDLDIFNQEFKYAIDNSKFILFKFYWKPFGDSILAFSVIIAILDYLKLNNLQNKKLILDNDKFDIIKDLQFDQEILIENVSNYYEENNVVLISDLDYFQLPNQNYHYTTEGRNFVPIQTREKKYFTRPERYYARMMIELGITPLRKEYFLPNYKPKKSKKSSEEKYCLLINFSGHIEKKYGLKKYYKLSQMIYEKWGIKSIFVTNSTEEDPEIYHWLHKKNVEIVSQKSLEELCQLALNSEFVVSNDTGLAHLLSMLDKKIAKFVFCIFCRHDYVKWSTGNANQIIVSNKLADLLTKNHYSLKRDKEKIKPQIYKNSWAYKISSMKIINQISKYYEDYNSNKK